jgi:opacity protein-like surface antigen
MTAPTTPTIAPPAAGAPARSATPPPLRGLVRAATGALAGALALGAATPVARAGERNEVTLGTWNRALRSPSANAVTEDNLVGGALTYGRDLGLRPDPRLAVWAVGAFTWSGADGVMFQTLGTDVDVLGFSAGARARYTLHERVIASARLDAGAARTHLQLSDGTGPIAEGARWGVIATAAVGLDLLAVANPYFSLGLRLELGYTAAQAPALTLSPTGGGGEAMPLPMHEASIGHLDLGGRWAGLSIVARL